MDSGQQRFPRYRLITGPDDDAFCYRVSDALALGFELYGPPVIATAGERVVAAQALVWRDAESEPPLRPAPTD